MVLKKIVFSLVVAVLLIVGWHGTVRAETLAILSSENKIFPMIRPQENHPQGETVELLQIEILPEISPIDLPEQNKSELTCENLDENIQQLRLLLELENDLIAQFMQSAADVYGEWGVLLTAKEQVTFAFPQGYFVPLLASIESLDMSSSTLYEQSTYVDDWSEDAKIIMRKCWRNLPNTDQAIDAYNEFQMMHMEHISSAANFLSIMQSRLAKNVVVWRDLEGQVVAVTEGYFLPVQTEGEHFYNAQPLIVENGQSVVSQFQRFLDILAE